MIDFSNVSSIITPEGEVAVIQRENEILWQKSRLPFEFQEVDYIESTGTQWLDINQTINTNTDTVELVFQILDATVYKWVFGEHDDAKRFGIGSGDGINKRNIAYGNTTYKVNDNQVYDSKHTFLANQNGIFIDNVKIANFSSFASTSTLYLFNLNLSGGNYLTGVRIWSYKQTRNNEIISELVSCYRKSDNEVSMYDLANNTFLANKGSGKFIIGNIV